ncbi:hypothetical protein NS334_04470 [Sphingomonas endophytica]|uniref:MlaB-like STAS domain-containing protein n=1 Tax=Sphingomonas endophytica TaxID=869719 RepID=A0A147I781_9SPHN|nr:hypothetical protein NS334_04470 [Sphingomonas endophytica]
MPTIGVLADELSHAFASSEAIRLDLSDVTAPDLSLVQLVAAARIAARDGGHDFALAAPVDARFGALLVRAGFNTASADDAQFWFHGDAAQ